MKTKKIIAGVMGLLLSASLAGCGKDAATQAEAATMRLRKTEGTVAINDAKGTNVEARENLGLYSGYNIGTQAASFAWVDLDSVKLTKLDEESRVKIEKDGKNLKINLESGNLFFHVTKPLGGDESMEIRTSTMALGIRGTCGWIEAEDESTNVFLLEGKVEVESPAGTEKANVLAGEMAAVSKDGSIVVKEFDKDAIPAFVLDEADDDGKLTTFIEGMAAESGEAEGEYEEHEEYFVLKEWGTGDGKQIDLFKSEWVEGPFTINESVDLYSNFGVNYGYTKPNVTVYGVSRLDDGEWLYVPFQDNSFLIKAEDFEKFTVKNNTQTNEVAAAPNSGNQAAAAQNGGNKNQNSGNTDNTGNSGSQAPAQTGQPAQTQQPAPAEQKPTPAPATQIPAPAQSTGYKYTAEEAAAIYEAGLRAAGFRKPEEVYSADMIAMFGPTAGMGWGINEIPLNDPQAAVTSSINGFNGQGFTLYYIENLGVEDGCVKLKVYYG